MIRKTLSFATKNKQCCGVHVRMIIFSRNLSVFCFCLLLKAEIGKERKSKSEQEMLEGRECSKRGSEGRGR